MNTPGNLSPWKKAFFISCLCHGLFMLVLFFFRTTPADLQPEITELYEMDLTQSFAIPSDPLTDSTPDGSAPDDEQLVETNPATTVHDEKQPLLKSDPSTNIPAPKNSLSTIIKRPLTPKNTKRNLQIPTIIKSQLPVYPEKISQTKQPFKITLVIDILESGQPIVLAVEKSSGSKELDDAAITAINQWIFSPAIDLDTGKQVHFPTAIDFNYPPDKITSQ